MRGERYIFMGTPPLAATILEKLCTELHPPVAVVTQVGKAQGRGKHVIPSAVETYARTQDLDTFATLDVNSVATVEALRVFKPELILVAAFGQILKDEILNLPTLYCLNVHASLLPRYRGAAPVQRAIWDGLNETGITIQKMAKKLDTGDTLLQKKLTIDPDDTSYSLMNRLAVLGSECLLDSLKLIEKNEEVFTPQDHTQATYAKKIDKSDAPLQWTKRAIELSYQIRALQPWPVAECLVGKDRMKIFKAEIEEKSFKAPGEVETDHKTYLRVGCGQGMLSLTEVQLENRKRLDIKSFLNSYRGNFPFKTLG